MSNTDIVGLVAAAAIVFSALSLFVGAIALLRIARTLAFLVNRAETREAELLRWGSANATHIAGAIDRVAITIESTASAPGLGSLGASTASEPGLGSLG